MSSSSLDRATAYANDCVNRAHGDVSRLTLPVQTVAVVDTAQGIIDNGGLAYFYESDFPGTPPYSFFVEAYRRIGAEVAASCLDASVRMFPFSEPHLHARKRLQWLENVRDDEKHEFVKLSRRMCGDETVFLKLAEYVEVNRDSFKTE